jgi:hypothetical protein
MQFSKNTLALILVMFIIGCTAAQKKTKQYKFSEVGWTIEVPGTFEVMDSSQSKKTQDRGRKAIEDTYDTPLDFSSTRTLITLSGGRFNTLYATVTPFDPSVDGEWNEACEGLKQILMETFSSQAPTAVIDTSSSVEEIDKLKFDRFYMKITLPNKLVLHSFLYSRLHRGYDFGINFTYTDEKIGKQMKEIIVTSRFDK